MATLRFGAFDFEVFIPEFARRQLQNRVGEDISLHTIDYLEGNPMQGRMTPRLIGFLSEVEREFFELFCSVDGVGVKKALRAMVRPVREGRHGDRRARRQGAGQPARRRPGDVRANHRQAAPQGAEVALLVAREEAFDTIEEHDLVQETFQVLRQLATPRPKPAAWSTPPWPARRNTPTCKRCCRPSISRGAVPNDECLKKHESANAE